MKSDEGSPPNSRMKFTRCLVATSFLAAALQLMVFSSPASATNVAWSVIDPIGAKPFNSVSCTGLSNCLATDSSGVVSTWSGGTSWVTTRVNAGHVLKAISCISGFCGVGDSTGNAYTFNGTSWTTATTWAAPAAGDSAILVSILCPSTSFLR